MSRSPRDLDVPPRTARTGLLPGAPESTPVCAPLHTPGRPLGAAERLLHRAQAQRSRDLLRHDPARLLGQVVLARVLVRVQPVQLLEGLVQADVGDQGLDGAQGCGGGGAPVGEVRELPPPQRLGRTARLVVGQAVAQVRDQVGQAVGDAARDRGLAGLVRVEDLGVDVDRLEEGREALAQAVRVRFGAQVRLVSLVRDDVLVRAEPAPASSSWETWRSRIGTACSGSSTLDTSVTATMNDLIWSAIWTAKSSGSCVTEFSVASDIEGTSRGHGRER